MIKVTDEQIAEVWKRTRNYAAVERELGIRRQTVRSRVMRMRAEGADLPPSQPVGYSMTSERARAIGKLRLKNKQ